jgi:hypothetical protein
LQARPSVGNRRGRWAPSPMACSCLGTVRRHRRRARSRPRQEPRREDRLPGQRHLTTSSRRQHRHHEPGSCRRWRPIFWCTCDSAGETTETWTRGSARRGSGCGGTGTFLPRRCGAWTCPGALGVAGTLPDRSAGAVGAAAAGGFPPRRLGGAGATCAGTEVANGTSARAPPVSPASATTAPAQRETMARAWASPRALSRRRDHRAAEVPGRREAPEADFFSWPRRFAAAVAASAGRMITV